MASNRDPRKDYRINRRGRKVTSSADRSKRAKKASAPKPTSSSTRSRGKNTGSKKVTSDKTGRVKRGNFATKGDDYQRKLRNVGKKPAKISGSVTPTNTIQRTVNLSSKRSSLKPVDSKTERNARQGNPKNVIKPGPKGKAVRKNPVTGPPRGAQGPATPPQQGPSKRVSGLIGSRGPAPRKGPPTQGAPKGISFKNRPRVKVASGSMKTNSSNLRARGTAALAGAVATGALLNPVSKAKKKASDSRKKEASKSVGKYNTKEKDGSVSNRKKVGSKKVGPKKVGPKKVGTIAESFDKAFAAARKAGKSEFTFKGKKYNTKTK